MPTEKHAQKGTYGLYRIRWHQISSQTKRNDRYRNIQNSKNGSSKQLKNKQISIKDPENSLKVNVRGQKNSFKNTIQKCISKTHETHDAHAKAKI